ncbi:MAG: PaaI family thioesterase [Spongiibacter sp.]|uniref:PaaI family thioesterase n=1 Tax=Spongiibacter thalassae TaxID=2721624 RepID=A0ABX1GJ33_9GAMM|nr:PaaI family thioesterase [Spongiibacter thalassae]MDX1505189.1 PaaI family thioesterase [Spongiibacter sp.]NKI18393.1 PaaI family thioesterase [Spongiibacter thalassae]
MIDKQELADFFAREFPQADIELEHLGKLSATLRKRIGHSDLRPGGTVSGPTLMALADAALYAAILGEIGLVALAVTTNLNINFLRKPSANRDILAECRLIKLGKTLAVGEVSLYSEGNPDPVAHVVGTYSIPPQR